MLIRINPKYLYTVLLLLGYTSLLGQSGTELDSIRFSKMIERDTHYLKENLDDSLLYIHSNGLIESKTDHIRNIAEGKLIYQSIKVIESRYVIKEDYILGYGLVHVAGVLEGVLFDVRLRFSNIYRKRNNSYKFLYWQSTKMK